MDAEERESASSLRQKILTPHAAKRQLLSLVTNNPLPSAEKLSEAPDMHSEGTDILKYPLSPHARTKNSIFVCETDGSDEGPVSELQRITSQPGIPTLPAGPIGNLKFSNCRRLLTIQYPKPSEAFCFCNLALLNRMSVAQHDV